MLDISALVEAILSLPPIVPAAAPVIALLVQLAKKVGIVPDGGAGLLALVLNFAAYVALLIAGQLEVIAEFEAVMQAAILLIPLLLSLAGSTGTYRLLKSAQIPFFG